MDRIGKGYVNVPSPTGVTVTATTNNTVSLSWQPAQGAAGYNVYRGGAKANPQTLTGTFLSTCNQKRIINIYLKLVLPQPPGMSTQDFNRAPPTPTTCAPSPPQAVRACPAPMSPPRMFSNSAQHNTTQHTHPQQFSFRTTGTPPPIQPPTGLTVTASTDKSISLRWNEVAGASDYNVYRNGVLVPTSPAEEAEFTDTGLNEETTYSYQVSSLTMIGVESSRSAPVQGTTKGGWNCQTFTASNYAHVADGRAHNNLGIYF